MYKFCVFNGNNSQIIREKLNERGIWEEIQVNNANNTHEIEKIIAEANFIWKPTSFSLRDFWKWDHLLHEKDIFPIFNHFENNRIICTKTGLLRTLSQYYKGNSIYSFTPTSFILTAGYQNEEFHKFIEYFNHLASGNYSQEKLPIKHCEKNVWILKPANLNQGKGIEIFQSLKNIQEFLAKRPLNSLWVVQKYIERPLLYKKRKFDIRVWCLFTDSQAFLYKEGYIRTSSEEYDLNNSLNFVHLTNNCLQKYGKKYGQYEDGNTISFEDFQVFLNQEFQGEVQFKEHIFPKIIDLVIDVFLASQPNINPNKKNNCFELLGLDFLIDEDLRTWLLEVNTNPYLGFANKYIENLILKMINDLLALTIDKKYPPSSVFSVSSSNDFSLIFSNNPPINLHRPYPQTSFYPLDSFKPLTNKSNIVFSGKNRMKIMKTPNIISLFSELKGLFNENPLKAALIKEMAQRVIHKLKNWEYLSEKEVHDAYESFVFLFNEKRAQVFLFNQEFLEEINGLLQIYENIPLKIQKILFAFLQRISQKSSIFTSFPNGFLNILMKLALSSCEEQEKNLELMQKKAVKCLNYLFKHQISSLKEIFIREGGALCISCVLFFSKNTKNLLNYEEFTTTFKENPHLLNLQRDLLEKTPENSTFEKIFKNQPILIKNHSFFVEFFRNIDRNQPKPSNNITKIPKNLPVALPFSNSMEKEREICRKQAFLSWQERKIKEKKEEMEMILLKKKEEDQKKQEQTELWRSSVLQKVQKQRILNNNAKGKKKRKCKKQRSFNYFFENDGIVYNSGFARTALEFVRNKKRTNDLDKDIQDLVKKYNYEI